MRTFTHASDTLVLTAPERLATGAAWGEGPVWLPATSRVRWSDIPNDRILEWEEGADAPLVHRTGVGFTNGRALHPDGSLIQCSHGRRAIERERGGSIETLVDHWGDARLNSPNDVIIARDGSILFTDPPYGIVQPNEGHHGVQEYGDCWVFRFDPSTRRLDPIVLDVEEPNGLALSPDERMLYVADTSSVLRADGSGNRHIRAYDVQPGWHCKNGRTVITPGGVADGFRVDEVGRIWTSASAGIEVYQPDGTLLMRVDLPETASNLCFGGHDGTDLFITATTSLYRLRTSTTDAAGRR